MCGSDRVHAVIETFDVDPDETIKIRLGRALDGSDVRDAGVIHQNMNSFATEQLAQNAFHLRLVSHIANVDRGVTTILAESARD